MKKIKLLSRGEDNWLQKIGECTYILHTENNSIRIIYDQDNKTIIGVDPSGGPMIKVEELLPVEDKEDQKKVKKIKNWNNIYIITENPNKQKPQEPYELFGIECGNGWNKLITPILDYIDLYNSGHDDKIEILQIKEKFGGLRIYTSFSTPELDQLIDDAEEQSFKTCEYCGSTENVSQTKTGWIKTLCSKCMKGKD